MFDASGKMNDGVMGMNNNFFGSLKECIEIEVPQPGNGLMPFGGKYIFVYLIGGKSAEDRMQVRSPKFNLMQRMPIFINPMMAEISGPALVKNIAFQKITFNIPRHIVSRPKEQV